MIHISNIKSLDDRRHFQLAFGTERRTRRTTTSGSTTSLLNPRRNSVRNGKRRRSRAGTLCKLG